jgi:hypothetical protein
VNEHDVRGLDVLGVGRWHDQCDVGKAAQLPALTAEQADRAQPQATCLREGPQQIAAAAAGADAEQDVAAAAEGLHLPRVDLVIADVIGPRRQGRQVAAERQRGEATPSGPLEAPDQLAGEVLRIRGAAAVAAEQQLAAIAERRNDLVGGTSRSVRT